MPMPTSGYLFLIDFDLCTVCKRQTNAILNKIMDLFHNEIISFCQWKATIRLAAVGLDLLYENDIKDLCHI
jgi:hypothetical protein